MNVVLSLAVLGLLGCIEQSGEPSGSGSPDSGKGSAAKPSGAKAPGAETSGAKTSGAPEKAKGDWIDGDTIPSGIAGVPDIKILKVHKNGSGEACGTGKTASLRYKAMTADGRVLDPGTRPFSFAVGSGRAIKGWDVVVARMRVGDSFTITLPQQLAYGPSKGDLKFDMELLTIQ